MGDRSEASSEPMKRTPKAEQDGGYWVTPAMLRSLEGFMRAELDAMTYTHKGKIRAHGSTGREDEQHAQGKIDGWKGAAKALGRRRAHS
jgi:hypothetical protein